MPSDGNTFGPGELKNIWVVSLAQKSILWYVVVLHKLLLWGVGSEKACFLFSTKLRYEEDFFERISRILNFFIMFWRSNRNVVIVSGQSTVNH